MMNASEREQGLVAHTQPYRRAAHTPPSVPTETAGAIPGRSNKPRAQGRLGGGKGSPARVRVRPGGGRAGRERRGGAGPVAFAGRGLVKAPTHAWGGGSGHGSAVNVVSRRRLPGGGHSIHARRGSPTAAHIRRRHKRPSALKIHAWRLERRRTQAHSARPHGGPPSPPGARPTIKEHAEGRGGAGRARPVSGSLWHWLSRRAVSRPASACARRRGA